MERPALCYINGSVGDLFRTIVRDSKDVHYLQSVGLLFNFVPGKNNAEGFDTSSSIGERLLAGDAAEDA